jgi:hypothetical protein
MGVPITGAQEEDLRTLLTPPINIEFSGANKQAQCDPGKPLEHLYPQTPPFFTLAQQHRHSNHQGKGKKPPQLLFIAKRVVSGLNQESQGRSNRDPRG